MPTFKLNSSHLNVSIFERNGNSLNGILKKTLAEPWELAKFIKQNFLNDVDKLKNSAEVDHIKVHYGALSIFNAIYKKYYWTSEATALKLYIPFLHSIDDMIHSWSLGLCSSNLYYSKKVFKNRVPRDMTEATIF
ncbi:hypothetical protein AB4K20DRAFT_1985666 [Rhizopus microsporus]